MGPEVYAVRLPNPMAQLARLRAFGQAQREMLRASNQPGRPRGQGAGEGGPDLDEQLEQSLLGDLLEIGRAHV